MIAFLALLVWLYLYFLHGRFWQSGPELLPTLPLECPDVDIVIPARDEAGTIAPVIASLLAQDYPGRFRVFLVDDNSTDGTAMLAGNAPHLHIITGAKKPAGWAGKLWALSQGVAASDAPVLLFADADITHDPRHLSALVARLQAPRVDMASEMVRLNCVSLAERGLVPAFVYFFQMLYPFSKVNDPFSKVAAAAGGTVLIRREALERIGGIEKIKMALIDDVALAREVKKFGPIYLGHSGLATSIRPYPGFADVFRMVSRSAFTQLNYSAFVLAGTLVSLALVWLVPALRGRVRPWLAFSVRLGRLCDCRDQLPADSGALPGFQILGVGVARDCALLHGRHLLVGAGLLARHWSEMEKPQLRSGCGMSAINDNLVAVQKPEAAPEIETWSAKTRRNENFPVGSWLIRKDLRAHVHAYYSFARNADDIADNAELGPNEKISRLDRMEAVLTGATEAGLAQRVAVARKPCAQPRFRNSCA